MKKYKFKFSPVLITLLILLLAVSVLGLTLNLIRFFNSLSNEYLGVKPIIFVVLCLGLFITAILTIFFSGYKIKNNELYFYVGLIKITLDIKKVLLIKELNKKRLFLVYKDGKFTAIIINQKEFSIFIKALKEINPKIIYESAENQD
jgi:hypothetical protein